MYKGTEQKHLVNIPLNVLRSRIEIAFVNFNLLNFSRSLLYIQHVSTKCENTDQQEIPDIISTNIFLCKKFSLQFYQRVINKKHWPIREWRSKSCNGSVGYVYRQVHKNKQHASKKVY